MNLAEKIYNKLYQGDALTDEELQAGIEHFKQVSDLLMVSGPVFRLAADEANRIYCRLRDFQVARNRR